MSLVREYWANPTRQKFDDLFSHVYKPAAIGIIRVKCPEPGHINVFTRFHTLCDANREKIKDFVDSNDIELQIENYTIEKFPDHYVARFEDYSIVFDFAEDYFV